MSDAQISRSQYAILAAYGALLWFLAAMLVRVLAPMGALEGSARLLTYALVIPGTIPAILIGLKITSVTRSNSVLAVAMMTAAAGLLDGIALAWFPALYGDNVAHVLAGAAVILWGVGVGLALSFVLKTLAR